MKHILNPHIFADPDPGSQNPDPKHWGKGNNDSLKKNRL